MFRTDSCLLQIDWQDGSCILILDCMGFRKETSPYLYKVESKKLPVLISASFAVQLTSSASILDAHTVTGLDPAFLEIIQFKVDSSCLPDYNEISSIRVIVSLIRTELEREVKIE